MRYKRNIVEIILYLVLLAIIIYWRKEHALSFLLDKEFLDILLRSTVTLSGIGIAMLGIISNMPGRIGEREVKAIRYFFAILKRGTAYFLLSSFLAFSSISFLQSLTWIGSEDGLITMMACSALSSILFLSGLLHLLYVCLKIEEAKPVNRTV
jgi:hypothetical protein